MADASLGSGAQTPSPAAGGDKAQWWALERRVSSRHLWLLGGPLVAAFWLYFAFLIVQIARMAHEPIVHEFGSSIDARWLFLLAPAMAVPVIVVWSFINWLGWQFFRHN